jgi:hypothetical protein
MKKKIFVLAAIFYLLSNYIVKAQDGWIDDGSGNIHTNSTPVAIGIDWEGVSPFDVTDWYGGFTMAKFGFNSPIYLGEGFIGFNAFKFPDGTMRLGNGCNGTPVPETRGGWISFVNGNFNFIITNSDNGCHALISSYTKPFVINNQGKVGIGTGDNALTQQLEVAGTVKATKFMLSDGSVLGAGQWTTTGSNIYFNTGNILIGTTTQTNTNYKLDVAGKVRANEVTVNTTGADFVFEKNYKLLSLPEVENYIAQHKHLPDISPATEMQANGVSVGEMQAKLLQKVEELTLYVIEQQKIIEKQNQRIGELEKTLKNKIQLSK